MTRRLLFLSSVLATQACHPFRDVEANGQCGNHVVEPAAGEDCDGEAPGCGPAGTAAACRFVCAEETACPEGWACGPTGRCEAATGEYRVSRVIPVEALYQDVGDVDGDGKVDLMTSDATGTDVFYGDRAGDFLSHVRQPTPHVDLYPGAADLDDDGRVDMWVPTATGVQVFRGLETRQLLPVPVAQPLGDMATTSLRAVTVRVSALEGSQDALFVAQSGGRAVLRMASREVDDSGAAEILGAFGSPLVDRLGVANVDVVRNVDLPPEMQTLEDPDGADEILLASAGSPDVALLSVTCPEATRCLVTPRPIPPLPAGWTADSAGTFFGDLDADGRQDLIVPARGDGDAGLAVAYGQPPLPGEEDAVVYREFAVPAVLGSVIRCGQCQQAPNLGLLAVADLNRDQRADFVTHDGIIANLKDPDDPLGARIRVGFEPPHIWHTATVGDFNGDGHTDVAAVRPGSLDLVLSADSGVYNPITGPVLPEARSIASGDFDGDLATDLVVLEREGTVSIYFNGSRGAPTEREVVAQLPEVTSVQVQRREVGGVDGIDDLLLVAPTADGERLVQLQGTSTRGLMSPLPQSGRVTAAVVPARLSGADGLDLLLVEVGGPPLGPMDAPPPEQGSPAPDGGPPPAPRLVFRVAESGPLLDGNDAVITELTADADCQVPQGIGIFIRAADLDGDDTDELVLLQTFSPEPGMEAAVATTWRLTLMKRDGDRLVCRQAGALRSLEPPTSVEVADLDGDGRLDVVVTAADNTLYPSGMPPSMGTTDDPAVERAPGLAIWWGADVPLGLEGVEPAFHPLPDDAPQLLVASIELDAHPGRELAILGAGRLYTARFDGGREPVGREVELPTTLARRLNVADVNADGLEDLVVGTDHEVLLLEHQPCTAELDAADLCKRSSP